MIGTFIRRAFIYLFIIKRNQCNKNVYNNLFIYLYIYIKNNDYEIFFFIYNLICMYVDGIKKMME